MTQSIDYGPDVTPEQYEAALAESWSVAAAERERVRAELPSWSESHRGENPASVMRAIAERTAK